MAELELFARVAVGLVGWPLLIGLVGWLWWRVTGYEVEAEEVEMYGSHYRKFKPALVRTYGRKT